MIKKETVWLIALAAFVIGFLSGIVFSVYKAPQTASTQQTSTTTPDNSNTIANLEKYLASHPDDAEAWSRLGNTYFDSDQPAKAIAAYDRSLAIEPNNADVLTDKGVMHRRNGEPEKALAAFTQAAAVDPAHEVSRFNRGVVLYYDMKDIPGAIAAWEDLLAVNPQAVTPGEGKPLAEMIDEIKATQQK